MASPIRAAVPSNATTARSSGIVDLVRGQRKSGRAQPSTSSAQYLTPVVVAQYPALPVANGGDESVDFSSKQTKERRLASCARIPIMINSASLDATRL
jgi:hypothetical protein